MILVTTAANQTCNLMLTGLNAKKSLVLQLCLVVASWQLNSGRRSKAIGQCRWLVCVRVLKESSSLSVLDMEYVVRGMDAEDRSLSREVEYL